MGDQPLSYYSLLDSEETLLKLKSGDKGLSGKEANRRLRFLGYNSLAKIKKTHVLIEFAMNFRSPLVIILMCVAGISFFLGEKIDALIVTAMVLLSVSLNFVQEHKASMAAEKLKSKVIPKAVVVREGKAEEIQSSHLTVGDVIELNAGDMIAADCRVIASKDLYVNQSALTGESFPVEKDANKISIHNPDAAQMQNIVFAGTSVVTGSARAVVIKIGANTEFGAIAAKISQEEDSNEFTKGVQSFSNMILRIILIFVVIIFFANSFIKHDILQSLTFAIAVAVGLTPEFLPMIMTVTMGRGSVNMAKKGVIVKKLSAIPTFGSMDILCTDKTGTLTEDKIHLVKYVDIKGIESEEVFLYTYINSNFQTGITNPMDKAVVDYKSKDLSKYKKIDELPFDFERRRMSVVVSYESNHLMVTKGAPEEVISVCTQYLQEGKLKPLDKKLKDSLNKLYLDMSRDGFRVLAVATRMRKPDKSVYTKADEHDMVIQGFVAFLDPAKRGVRQSIDDLEAMGIEVKVITGDNELVTAKICRDADIVVKGMLLGSEIDALDDEKLYEKAINSTIFARCSPLQKTRIITILRSKGRVVGYMGDGINDAPSLKAADVGISVSNGVDVARESADIILTNKSLHELKAGVAEGRITFGNTMKYVLMGLSSNFGNMFSVLGAVLFLPFLPMLPIQILLNNFLYDISQLTIPMDNVDAEYIEKPKRWNNKHIRNFMLVFGPISSVFDFITFGVLFMIYRNIPGGFQTGWFMESLATQVLVIHVIRTRKLPFIQSNASPYLWITTTLAIIVGWLIPATSIGTAFGFVSVSWSVTFVLAGIVALYLVCAEIGKKIYYSNALTQ